MKTSHVVAAGLVVLLLLMLCRRQRQSAPSPKVDIPPLGGLPSYPLASPTANHDLVFGTQPIIFE